MSEGGTPPGSCSRGWGCSGGAKGPAQRQVLLRGGSRTHQHPDHRLTSAALPPTQGSHGCRQPVLRGLAPRGQGSLEQERRWKQYLEDERIALFLQNEEFMKELQRNRDFLLALERGEKRLQKPLLCFSDACLPPAMLPVASQNHRMVGVGRDLWGSSSPALLPKQGHLQQAAEDLVPKAQKQSQCGMQPAGTGPWAAPRAPATRVSSPCPPLWCLWHSPAKSLARSHGNAL